MKRRYFGFLIFFVLGLAACVARPVEQDKMPTPPTTEEVATSETPMATEKPEEELSEVPETKPTEDSNPTKVPEVTEVPKDESITLTATPVPEATPTPSPAPAATETPKPTKAPTVTETPTEAPKDEIPSPTPKPTEVPEKPSDEISPEIAALLKTAEVKENTRIRGTVCANMQEADRYLWENAQKYSGFALIVEDASALRSVKEYRELYPEITNLNIDKIEIYTNGVCMVLSDVSVVYDATLCKAIRTGDQSELTDTDKEVLSFLKGIIAETKAEEKDRYEAVKSLHDYLVHNVKYDENYRAISHTPEGLMRNKTAVCDGYARTYRLLLLMLGIESDFATGSAGGEDHAWNLVEMEDGWYHVDVTWDDPIVPGGEDTIQYLYFLKNDEDMQKTHAWERTIDCNGEKYRMYSYRDVMCSTMEDVEAVYEKQTSANQIVFCYPKECELTQDGILDYVMNCFGCGCRYYPEKEMSGYRILTVVNPLVEE